MPVAVDVRDLVGHPGASRSVRVRQSVNGLATGLARVPEDRELSGELLFESLVDGILVSGSLEGSVELVCARCLKPTESRFTVEVRELFALGATLDDDEYPVAEGMVDLEPMIRDAVLLAMPFAPLCVPDCLGLCERCGGDRNVGECTCAPEADPRWSVLGRLVSD
jgi:uncharacterized protein